MVPGLVPASVPALVLALVLGSYLPGRGIRGSPRFLSLLLLMLLLLLFVYIFTIFFVGSVFFLKMATFFEILFKKSQK